MLMSKQTLKSIQEYHITNTASFRCCTSTGTEIDCDHCTVTDPIRKRCSFNRFSLAENAVLESELEQMLQTSIIQHLFHDRFQLDNCKNAVIFFFSNYKFQVFAQQMYQANYSLQLHDTHPRVSVGY